MLNARATKHVKRKDDRVIIHFVCFAHVLALVWNFATVCKIRMASPTVPFEKYPKSCMPDVLLDIGL